MRSSKKSIVASELNVSRRSLYYHPKMPAKDWQVKCQIEEVLREHPSYGHRRLALHLRMNKKKIQRVMKIFGIKAYRRRGLKWKKTKNIKVEYPNLLLATCPKYPNHVWVTDFTRLVFHEKVVYVATVEDLFTREIVGMSVYTNHAVQLVMASFMNALHTHPRPDIFHSDNGSEYNSEVFVTALKTVGTQISRSAPGCPWENGYQESFYSQFKVDFGDPDRFKTLGELVFAIYQTIWQYNHTRIHLALRMSPLQFAEKMAQQYYLEQ